MNHAKIFCKSILAFFETLLLVRFSRIVFRNAENAATSLPTFVCFEDSRGDVLCVSVLSNIDKLLYIIAKVSLVNIEFALCEFRCCMFLINSVNTFENYISLSSVWIS